MSSLKRPLDGQVAIVTGAGRGSGSTIGAVEDTDVQAWKRTIDTNLFGTRPRWGSSGSSNPRT